MSELDGTIFDDRAALSEVVRQETAEAVCSAEFRRQLAQSYIDNVREFIQCCVEYLDYDIAVDDESFNGLEEWIIIKPPKGDNGETWEKQNPMLFLMNVPEQLIYDTLDDDFITIFDVIASVGFKTDSLSAAGAIAKSSGVFIRDFVSRNFRPRHPDTKERWTLGMLDMHSQPLKKVYPDLSWILSFDEAEKWAVKSFSISLKGLREKLKERLSDNKAEQIEQSATAAKTNDRDRLDAEKPLDSRTKRTLLVTIAALCERAGITPLERGLPAELAKNSDKLGVSASADAISRYLKEAAELTK